MILCSPTPTSILKASLLSYIYHDLPCIKGEEQALEIFAYTNHLDADEFFLQTLINQLKDCSHLDLQWLLARPGEQLEYLISANLRYSASNQSAVIFSSLEEAISHGYNYCLQGIGCMSNVFIKRARTVAQEIHKMLAFVRFKPSPDNNTLIAKPRLYHQTADIILKRFALRYPKNRLVFILPNQNLILEKGTIIVLSSKEYDCFIDKDDFEIVWDVYYKSQYIPARKNIRLVSRYVPQKYWNWLSEGKFLQEESQKKNQDINKKPPY